MAQLFVTSRLLNTLTTGPNHENWMTVGERTPILKLLNSRIISWLILLFSLRRLVSIILLTQKLLLWTKHMENSNYTLCGNSIQFNSIWKRRNAIWLWSLIFEFSYQFATWIRLYSEISFLGIMNYRNFCQFSIHILQKRITQDTTTNYCT